MFDHVVQFQHLLLQFFLPIFTVLHVLVIVFSADLAPFQLVLGHVGYLRVALLLPIGSPISGLGSTYRLFR